MRSGRWERPTSGQEGAHAASLLTFGLLTVRNVEMRSGGGVRKRSVGVRAWARLLGLEKTVVERVDVNENGEVVISVRPAATQRDRCPHCRRRCPGYDLGDGRRRWRALDLGTTFCFLEADAPLKRPGLAPDDHPDLENRGQMVDRARPLSMGGQQPAQPPARTPRPRHRTTSANGDQAIPHPPRQRHPEPHSAARITPPARNFGRVGRRRSMPGARPKGARHDGISDDAQYPRTHHRVAHAADGSTPMQKPAAQARSVLKKTELVPRSEPRGSSPELGDRHQVAVSGLKGDLRRR